MPGKNRGNGNSALGKEIFEDNKTGSDQCQDYSKVGVFLISYWN